MLETFKLKVVHLWGEKILKHWKIYKEEITLTADNL